MTEQEFQTFLRSIRPADRAAMDAAARRQAEAGLVTVQSLCKLTVSLAVTSSSTLAPDT